MPFQADADSPENAAPSGYYLLGLVVASAWRRRGVGRLLTDERLQWLADRGCASAYYWTHQNNAASRQLHEQLGFRRMTDEFWFPALPPDHAEVLYGLSLTGRPGRGSRRG